MPEVVNLEKENEGVSKQSYFFNAWSEFYQLTHRSDTTIWREHQSKKGGGTQITHEYPYRNVNVFQRNVNVVL
jgi:hypothetical protein